MTVADSLVYPSESDSTHPYTEDGNREFLEGKEFIETMTLVAMLAAATTSLRFTPFVLKLPIRPPVLVAKQASSIAYLSGNRLGLGVGLSPWQEDHAVMGVPWERRGKRFDECIDVVRGLTTGKEFEFHGEFYDNQPVTMTPPRPSRSRSSSAATPRPRCAARPSATRTSARTSPTSSAAAAARPST